MAFIINIEFAKPDVDFIFVRGAPTVITDAIFFAPLGNDLTDRIGREDGSFIRSSEATYLVGNGGSKITKSLTNIPRFEFERLLIEPEEPNYITNSYGFSNSGIRWDDWSYAITATRSIVSASDIIDSSDYPGSFWQRFQYTFTGSEGIADFLFLFRTENDSFAQNDKVTATFDMKGDVNFTVGKTLEIVMVGRDNANGLRQVIVVNETIIPAVTSESQIFSLTGTVTDVNVTKVDLAIGVIDRGGEGNAPALGDTCDLFFCATNLEKAPVSSSFIPTKTAIETRSTESGNTTWDFDDIPNVRDILAETLGTEIDSGTLVLDVLYKITADVGDHFYAGSVVGQYFVSLGTETADASNKVREVENQALGTLLLQWQPDYDDDIETDTDSGMMSGNADLDLLYNRVSTTTPSIRSTDGTNTVIHSFNYDSGTLYNVALQWFLDVNDAKMRISAVDASAPWGTPSYTEVAFDGSFPIGTNLSLADILLARTKLVNAKFFDFKLTDSEIEDETDYG